MLKRRCGADGRARGAPRLHGGHGLDRYEQLFADNFIDVDVLRDLTDLDLEKIGIALGHRDLLAPVYGWFTEGLDTPVLKEAKALLEQLSS